MLWYKSWLETRWRFWIGLGLLLCSAAAVVLTYPHVLKLTASMPVDGSGELWDRIREAIALTRTFEGYVWSEWFRKNVAEMVTLFAILLGTAGVLSHSGGALFTLSLPVSRRRLLGVRAATGLAELFILALVPSMLIPLLSPMIGESYAFARVLIHGFCLFVAGSLFFNLALLLSTLFSDRWRPFLLALGIAMAVAIIEQFVLRAPYGVFRVMSAEVFFRGNRLPWEGLLLSAAASAALYSGAVWNLTRRDF